MSEDPALIAERQRANRRASERRRGTRRRAEYKSLRWCDGHEHHRDPAGRFVKPPAAIEFRE